MSRRSGRRRRIDEIFRRNFQPGGSFGGNPLRQTIGVGRAERIERLEVYWPTTDKTQAFQNVPIDCRIRIREDQSILEILPSNRFPDPFYLPSSPSAHRRFPARASILLALHLQERFHCPPV